MHRGPCPALLLVAQMWVGEPSAPEEVPSLVSPLQGCGMWKVWAGGDPGGTLATLLAPDLGFPPAHWGPALRG